MADAGLADRELTGDPTGFQFIFHRRLSHAPPMSHISIPLIGASEFGSRQFLATQPSCAIDSAQVVAAGDG